MAYSSHQINLEFKTNGSTKGGAAQTGLVRGSQSLGEASLAHTNTSTHVPGGLHRYADTSIYQN